MKRVCLESNYKVGMKIKGKQLFTLPLCGLKAVNCCEYFLNKVLQRPSLSSLERNNKVGMAGTQEA